MKWKFKKEAKKIISSDWYDLATGEYIMVMLDIIKPEKVLDDKEQIQKLKKAIELIQSFRSALEEAGLFKE